MHVHASAASTSPDYHPTAAGLTFPGYHPHQVRHIVAHYHKLPELLFFTKPDTPADSRVFLPQAGLPPLPTPDPSPSPNPNPTPTPTLTLPLTLTRCPSLRPPWWT